MSWALARYTTWLFQRTKLFCSFRDEVRNVDHKIAAGAWSQFYIVLPSRRRGSLCYGSLHQIYCPHRSSENHNKQKQMSHCLVTWRFSRKLRSAIRANHIIYLPPTPSTHSLIISFSLKNITAVLGEHNWTYLRSHPVVFVWIYVQCNIFRSLIDWRSPYLFWSILVARAQ